MKQSSFYKRYLDLQEEAEKAINNYRGPKGVVKHANGDVEVNLVAMRPENAGKIIIVGRKFGPVVRPHAIQHLFDTVAENGGELGEEYKNCHGESWSSMDVPVSSCLTAPELFYLAHCIKQETGDE